MRYIHSRPRLYLLRNINKCVFGKWYPITEYRRIKRYRIRNGEVQIFFSGKWQEVREDKVDLMDWTLEAERNFGKEQGLEEIHAPIAYLTLI